MNQLKEVSRELKHIEKGNSSKVKDKTKEATFTNKVSSAMAFNKKITLGKLEDDESKSEIVANKKKDEVASQITIEDEQISEVCSSNADIERTSETLLDTAERNEKEIET